MKKKSFLCILLALVLIMGIAACGNKKESPAPQNPVNEETQENIAETALIHPYLKKSAKQSWASGGSIIYDHTIGMLLLNGEEVFTYRELEQSLRKYAEETEAYYEGVFEENLPDAIDWYNVRMETGFYDGFYDFELVPSVVRSDSNVFSFRSDIYGYYGGAHPAQGIFGHNFNTSTGEKLKLEDVVNDVDQLMEFIRGALLEKYDYLSEVSETVDETLEQYKNDPEYCSFLLDYDGLTMYFNYNLSSYSAGIQEVHISYKDQPELFKDFVKNIPGSYTVKLFEFSPSYFDIDKDGIAEKIEYYADPVEDSYEFRFYADGELTTFSVSECFYPELYIVKNGEFSYMYLMGRGYNDYSFIMYYDLNNGEPLYMGNYLHGALTYLGGSVSGSDDEKQGIYYVYQHNNFETFTDPSEVSLESRTNVLGTKDGERAYYVGEDGRLVPFTEYFRVDGIYQIYNLGVNYVTLTAKLDFEMSELNDELNYTGNKVAVKAGDILYYTYTDDKSFAILKTEKGFFGCIDVKTGDWPVKIDGIDIEEIFDGIMWAG